MATSMNQEEQSTSPEKKKVKSIIKQVLMIVFALLLLWLSFRGCNLNEIWAYSQKTNLWFIGLLIVSGIISHILRAFRWLFMLKPLSDHKLSLWNSFVAVITGYAVNVAIPRGGEVVRLVSITKSERLPWAGVLSTMLIDRLLDIALLVLFLGATLALLPKSILDTMPWLVPVGISMGAATLVGLSLLPKLHPIMKWFTMRKIVREKLPHAILSRIEALTEEFAIGTKSLTDPVAYPAIALLTFAIWFFYVLNFYCVILAFDLTSKVSLANLLVVFTIGSVGVLVPTPGSVGSFHFLVSRSLVLTTGISNELALAVATVLHIFAFIVTTVVPAAICLAVQSFKSAHRS
ncbi:MAG TPA: lysylphosphatidylglycerol synthase transmembrane domain-containing protein [Candidatus Obscuribacterales bacterium]